jgi:hypothetical protein
MFKLAAKTTPFPYDVTIPIVDDRGQTVRHKIRFLFKRLSRTQFDDLLKVTANDRDTPLNAEEGLQANVEQALGFCAGWQDVTGSDDAPLEFTADNLRLLFDHFPNSFGALVETYVKAWNGGEGARKN